MPDTPANQADSPQPPGQAPGVGFPQARGVELIGQASGAVTAVGIGASQGKATGEHALWRPLLASLAPGGVLLGDRYYSSYGLLTQWQAQGVDGVFELHSRRGSGLLAGQKEARVVWSKPVYFRWP